jgi:hypothetical protein
METKNMKRTGCRKGTFRFGDLSIKPWFPKIGTKRVQDVGNRLGCKRVEGKWDEVYGICIMHEDDRRKPADIRSGWTAPIKGAIVEWSVLDPRADNPEDDTPLFSAINVFLVGVEPQGPGMGLSLADDYPIYEDDSSQYSPYCYITNPDELLDLNRDWALELAKSIKDGKAGDYGLAYYTPEGIPCSHTHPEAVVSYNGSTVRDLYKGIKLKPSKPFKLRRYGKTR